jgi:hypothetical protein
LIDDPTAVTTVRRDWLADEQAERGWGRELARLFRRARRRWLRVVGYALVCVALATGAAARRPRSYSSRVVFRVAGSADRSLRDYVAGVVFSRARLAALGADRGDLDVELRGGRLAIRYRAAGAQRAYDVAAQLGALVVDSERGHELLLLEPGDVEPPGMGRVELAIWVGVLALFAALPLCAVAVGAFDARVYDLDDIRRLGLSTVGTVRPFDGDNAGALAARLAAERRGRIAPS